MWYDKWVKWIIVILSVAILILGLHGLYATFDKLDALNALTIGTSGELFFSIKIAVAKKSEMLVAGPLTALVNSTSASPSRSMNRLSLSPNCL